MQQNSTKKKMKWMKCEITDFSIALAIIDQNCADTEGFNFKLCKTGPEGLQLYFAFKKNGKLR